MRGSIVKRGKNSYTIILNIGTDSITGKRKQQWVSVKGNKKDAEKRLSELLHQIDTGSFIKPTKDTLTGYLEKWLKDYVWPNLAPRTAEGYEHIMRHHIIPTLGNIVMNKLKPEHLQRYFSEKLSGGLSAQTVRHHYTALHKALNTAVEWGLLSRNIADVVKTPHSQQTEMQTWDEEDVAKFLELAKDSPYYTLFYTALFTGMRRSEYLALRWSDLDLLLCQVYVNRSLHVLKGGQVIYRSPKTAKGRRMIALSPSMASVLREHYEKAKLERDMLGVSLKNNDLVFCQPDGSPLLPNTVTHAWIKLVRRNSLKPIRLHDARHTHASLMLKQGAHPKVVQERLGHAGIQITLDIYSHVAPGLQEAAAKRFDDILTAKYNKHGKEAIEKIR